MSIIEVKIPNVAESISEVRIASWLKRNGEYVKLDEAICEIETDKATQEIYAEAAGVLHTIAQEGDDVPVGAVVAKLDTSAGAPTAVAAPVASAPVAAAPVASAEKMADKSITPVAENILKDKGLPIDSVQGTGANGKITKKDVLSASSTETKASSAPAAAASAASVSTDREERREKMSKLRQTISRRLVSVKNETAMLTTFNEVDMKPIMDLRTKYKERFEKKHEIGLGFMSFFTKAACMALEEFPAVNAYIDGDEIVYHNYCDVSIAVSSPKGLMVPVIRNAEELSLAEIEKEIKRLATKARDGKLSIEDMQGGTFSITNGGVFGSMLSTPILNAPQAAIMGMHNIVERPVVVKGEIVVRPIMYLALSYDHRIIDGRESVGFLYRIKEYLEDPTRMILGV